MLVSPAGSNGRYFSVADLGWGQQQQPQLQHQQQRQSSVGGPGEEIELSLWTTEIVPQYKRVAQKILTAAVRRLPSPSIQASSRLFKFRFSPTSPDRRSTHFFEEPTSYSDDDDDDHHNDLKIEEVLDDDEAAEVEHTIGGSIRQLRPPASDGGQTCEPNASSAAAAAPEEKEEKETIKSEPALMAGPVTSSPARHKTSSRNLTRLTTRFKAARARTGPRLDKSLWRWLSQLSAAQPMDRLMGLSTSSAAAAAVKEALAVASPSLLARLPSFTAMISYSHSEARDYALGLKRSLEALGVSCYLDLHEILSGSDWEDSLNEAITGCETFVALVTPAYGSTLWTAREFKLADLLGKHIIPVNFGQHWPPASLAIQCATMQYIPWPPEPDEQEETDTLWRHECALSVARQIKLSIERMRARRQWLQRQQQQLNNETTNRNSSSLVRRWRLHHFGATVEASLELTDASGCQAPSPLRDSSKPATGEETGQRDQRLKRLASSKLLRLELPPRSYQVVSPGGESRGGGNTSADSAISAGSGCMSCSDGSDSFPSVTSSGGNIVTSSSLADDSMVVEEEEEEDYENGSPAARKPLRGWYRNHKCTMPKLKKCEWPRASKAFNRLKVNLTWSRAAAAAGAEVGLV